MGVSLLFPTIHGSFNRENPTFSNSQKFSPLKDSRYTVSGCPVSPTDCHTSCSNQVNNIGVLIETVIFILDIFLLLQHVNSSVPINIGHALLPVALQGRLPGSSWQVAIKVTQTKRFVNFLRQQKGIKGVSTNAPLPPLQSFQGMKDRKVILGDQLRSRQNWMVHLCDQQWYASRLILVWLYQEKIFPWNIKCSLDFMD